MARTLGLLHAQLGDRLEELSKEYQADEKRAEEVRILERHLKVVDLRARILFTAGLDSQRRYECARTGGKGTPPPPPAGSLSSFCFAVQSRRNHHKVLNEQDLVQMFLPAIETGWIPLDKQVLAFGASQPIIAWTLLMNHLHVFRQAHDSQQQNLLVALTSSLL